MIATEDKKNIVKYHNDLNSITFHNFGHIDFDLFMVLCSKTRDMQGETVSIPFDELRRLSGFNSHWSEEQFIKSLTSMNRKQLLSYGMIENSRYIDMFILFPRLIIDREKKILLAYVNADYRYILNDLTKNFTRFELQEFISLDSKYSKTLYRLLKQYRTTGAYITTLEEFKRLLGVPESYQNKKVMQKIVEPSVKALKPYFDNLSCEVQYEAKRGRPVKGYKFTFTPEKVQKQITKEPEKKKPKKSANKFHNFDQREYDYDDLERKLRKAIQKNG